eukprot:Plantae.Rhodophyta-Hildenbrandia_rubra.ctg51698.p1 GENE.Plantae.Rhodophyta-Hildenbrandia_rubra.ctg51698~~Plantae.Rhodophyta-Hildenbrandia_rubra.ctg51698.p1  ORF type:complete len:182 (-),score=4.65 Plantae.Rhodophyta-Hildenbrandia_rubra.ctg51698:109-654(-)
MHRKLIIAAALLALLPACASKDKPKPSATVIADATELLRPVYKRPNLVVADMDRSLKIYRDLLGFKPNKVETAGSDSFSYPVFNIPRDAKMRFVTLDDKDDNRAFALTEVTGVTLPVMPDTPHRTAHVIGVTDLSGKIKRVEKMGLKTSPSKTVDGTEFRFIEQAFTDPDGHLIVLYEVLR